MKSGAQRILFFVLICFFASNTFSANRSNVGIRFEIEGTAERVDKTAQTRSTITYFLRTKDDRLIQIHTPYESPKMGEEYKVAGLLYSDYSRGTTFIAEKSRQIINNDPKYQPIDGKIFSEINQIDQNIIKLIREVDTYKKEFVEVSGTVIKHYHQSNWYQIKGKYGTTLDIQGYGEVPVVNSEIQRVGVVYIDASGAPFLSELPKIDIINDKILRDEGKSGNSAMLIILGFVFILGVTIALTTYYKKLRNQEPEILMSAMDNPIKYEDINDTLILSTPSKTAKILPGRITIISEAHDKGESFPISGTPVHDGFTATIGKSEKCDITIANREEYSTVSREHAVFIYRDNKMWLQNLSKTNPTIVNGNQLTDEIIPLKDGDRIKMGLLELLFETFA
ncbi:MAG: FHA domain-containing protein [Candidatus Marinimicrobia bacterium]|nr:FHA domain-containing protein [Candidatus Neomarinimicrobiota bacterium]